MGLITQIEKYRGSRQGYKNAVLYLKVQSFLEKIQKSPLKGISDITLFFGEKTYLIEVFSMFYYVFFLFFFYPHHLYISDISRENHLYAFVINLWESGLFKEEKTFLRVFVILDRYIY